MSYPAEMKISLEKVAASRQRRQEETFPRLAPQERENILRTFHPDYSADAFRKIRIGPNQGDRTPLELADALEAPSILEATGIKLADILRREPDVIKAANKALRKRLEAAVAAIDAMMRECGSEPTSRYARNACIIGAAALAGEEKT